MSKPQPIYPHGEIDPNDLPQVVRDSVRAWEKSNKVWPHDALKALRDDTMNRCYCFTWNGCYYGVEYADGYIHT